MAQAQWSEMMVGMASAQGRQYQAEMEAQGMLFSQDRPGFVLTRDGVPVRSTVNNMGVWPDGTMAGLITFINMHDQGMVGFQRRGPDYGVLAGSALPLAGSQLTLPAGVSKLGGLAAAIPATQFGLDLPDLPIPDFSPMNVPSVRFSPSSLSTLEPDWGAERSCPDSPSSLSVPRFLQEPCAERS